MEKGKLDTSTLKTLKRSFFGAVKMAKGLEGKACEERLRNHLE